MNLFCDIQYYVLGFSLQLYAGLKKSVDDHPDQQW